MNDEFIAWFDWPQTVQTYGTFGRRTIPDFTPENFRYLVGKVNELAVEVARLRSHIGAERSEP